MKHLPKHLRPRWRYLAIAIETWPDADFDRRDFQRSLWFSAQNLLGDTGSADADLTALQFDFSDGTGEAIVRARRNHTDAARAVLACVDEIKNHPVGLRVSGISGTVRACEEKYLRGGSQIRDERKVVFGDAQRSAVDRDGRIDVRTDSAFAGTTELDFE